MPSSYITLWNADRCKLLGKYKQAGQKLEVLFGGPHISMPAFSKYKVSPGDYIYPVRVQQGTMYILGCMRVKVVQPIDEYVVDRPETFGVCDLSTGGRIFHKWMLDHPDQRYLCWTCCSEVVVADEATEIGLDIPIPPETISNLRFQSGKLERPIKHVTDGMITSVVSISGHTLRLTDASGAAFAELCSWS